MRRTLVLVAAAALLLLAAFWLARSCHRPASPIVVAPDTLPDSVITEHRPKPPTKPLERLVRHPVRPVVNVSRGTPDSGLIRRFAQMARLADSLRQVNESLKAAGRPPVTVPPPILPPAWMGYTDKGILTVWFSRSDGSVLRATAKLRPNFGMTVGVDVASQQTPQFYEDQAWVRTIRQVKKCAPATGVMTGVGALVNSQDRVLGAVIGGGATLLGCLVG